MPQTDNDRTIALAGVLQAVDQVRSIARSGSCNEADFKNCVDSVFRVNSPSTAEIYGGVSGVRSGLRLLVEQLRQPQNMEIARYTLTLLSLERKLARRRKLMQQILQGIYAAGEKLPHYDSTHDNVVASLADTYANTVSTLTPKIMVSGDQLHLSHAENANRIRALLLAGIRAAVLWSQSGGSRFTLLFRRKALLTEALRLLQDLDNSVAGNVH